MAFLFFLSFFPPPSSATAYTYIKVNLLAGERLECPFCERRRRAGSRHLQRDRNFAVEPKVQGPFIRHAARAPRTKLHNSVGSAAADQSVGGGRRAAEPRAADVLPAAVTHYAHSSANALRLFHPSFIDFIEILKCAEP